MIVVSNIISKLDDGTDKVIDIAKNTAKFPSNSIIDAFIIKTSIDARKGKKPQFVSSVGFNLNIDEKKFVSQKKVNVSYKDDSSELPKIEFGNKKSETPPVIIGFGPAGMFLGLVLAKNGYNPVIFERGEDVDKRVKSVENFWLTGKLNKQSNVQFGEGGAGTFSDGKLTTRINDSLCNYVLNEFVRFGAPSEISHKAKPHIGTDLLRNIVKEIKKEIISNGGKVYTSSQLTDVIIKNNSVSAIKINNQTLPCSNLFLAIGHSARDTFEMLIQKAVPMEVKPFSIGVRIEHLQQDINSSLYGKFANHPLLPQGEYQLSLRHNNRAVYTFCMCPGGRVVPSSSEEYSVVTNGMSEFARNEKNANSALVVSVSEEDFGKNPRDAIEFQRKYEKIAFELGNKNYSAPAQTLDCFKNKKIGLNIRNIKPSYSLGVVPCDFNKVFSPQITEMLHLGIDNFGKKIKCFNSDDAILTGIETRTSSPLRILRGEDRQSILIKGLYPCGEGAGYAGGIMSAAVDGVKTAISFMQNYKPN